MARRLKRVVSPLKKRTVSFNVSEDFFNTMEDQRRKFQTKTGINLSQRVISNLILKNIKSNFLDGVDPFNGTKKTNKR